MFDWTTEKEALVLELRKQGKTYAAIAKEMGTSSNSIKHKVRRLQQAMGMEKYSHPTEKAAQAKPLLESLSKPRLKILETHSGFGGMSAVYAEYGTVEGYDIVKSRVDVANGIEGVTVSKADSEREIKNLRYLRKKFDVVDIDPYGLPSRYFPDALGLIDDGYLILTFPMMGVAQINALTIKHYQVYWGIELTDKETYIDKIVERLKDYGYMEKRKIEVVDVTRIDRVFRLAIKVKKTPLTEIIGMKINR
jgi:DNA-binding CsgD family transcriptional regulator